MGREPGLTAWSLPSRMRRAGGVSVAVVGVGVVAAAAGHNAAVQDLTYNNLGPLPNLASYLIVAASGVLALVVVATGLVIVAFKARPKHRAYPVVAVLATALALPAGAGVGIALAHAHVAPPAPHPAPAYEPLPASVVVELDAPFTDVRFAPGMAECQRSQRRGGVTSVAADLRSQAANAGPLSWEVQITLMPSDAGLVPATLIVRLVDARAERQQSWTSGAAELSGDVEGDGMQGHLTFHAITASREGNDIELAGWPAELLGDVAWTCRA